MAIPVFASAVFVVTIQAPQAVKGKVQEGERLLPPAAQAFPKQDKWGCQLAAPSGRTDFKPLS